MKAGKPQGNGVVLLAKEFLTLSISSGPSECFLDTVMKEALWKELKDGEVALWVFRRSMPQV